MFNSYFNLSVCRTCMSHRVDFTQANLNNEHFDKLKHHEIPDVVSQLVNIMYMYTQIKAITSWKTTYMYIT